MPGIACIGMSCGIAGIAASGAAVDAGVQWPIAACSGGQVGSVAMGAAGVDIT
jgi:hypothetical protein